MLTGMALITMANRLRIRQGRAQAHTGCCGVVIGTTLLSTCGWLTAITTLRIVEPTATDFDVCQDRITPDPCEARAFTSGEVASFTTGRGMAELVGL